MKRRELPCSASVVIGTGKGSQQSRALAADTPGTDAADKVSDDSVV